ncbi:hypothetical protein BMW23_1120 [Bodo saltans virus]|uniref:Cas12f1-like TNB domain-containing protein n=1 Tax=Bodo saltans virus TaxID=2024608 RepID=A0A2H4UW47_9VIRU|nr:hypothetical protein QJ851_gp1100 [Bodo saltans virus]ATZ81163.1 hypothetical protein BMW23_1120 [Bodo saltans virus]
MKKKPDKIYRIIKVPLNYVFRNIYSYEYKVLQENIIKCNKIFTYSLEFLKLYCLHFYEINNIFPTINSNLIRCILNIITTNPRVTINEKKEITEFKIILMKIYNEHFKDEYIDVNICSTGLKTLFEYMIIQILTIYENNIKLHYCDYVKRFINWFCNKKRFIEHYQKTKNKIGEKTFIANLKKIHYDVLNVNIDDNSYKTNIAFHDLVKIIKSIVLPKKSFIKSLYYDLECEPLKYLENMHIMMLIINNDNKCIYNVYPLRTSIIPKYMKLDTTTLINLLMETDKRHYLREGNLVKLADEIWNKFFKLDNKVFKLKGYKFDHSILTDGVGCSIQFIKEEYYNKFVPNKKKITETYEYIDELEKEDYKRLKEKQIVAIDPNKGDLIYCVDGIEKERNQFRYTQDQRRKELKIKKYKKIREKLKKEEIIDGKTVEEWEAELSEKNRKELKFAEYKIYLKEKHKLNKKLEEFYEKRLFRKLNLNGYLNKKQSDQRMIKNFKEKFGESEKVVICIGDWSEREQMKNKEPTKGKGMRKTFEENGYELYLVNEYNTSCKCNVCEGECKIFCKGENPRPWKNNKIPIHGLLKCKTCKVLWNRDENSSCNIYKISKLAIEGKQRPLYLTNKMDK